MFCKLGNIDEIKYIRVLFKEPKGRNVNSFVAKELFALGPLTSLLFGVKWTMVSQHGNP